jgi:hypothetical protein
LALLNYRLTLVNSGAESAVAESVGETVAAGGSQAKEAICYKYNNRYI